VTHLALAALREKGLIQTWVQQNHDGLPQKAGFPQQDMIEIHGSWYDPSNPVVCYDGALKPILFNRMKEAADTSDLVIVLGTSLSGLNSDRMATAPAKRSLAGRSLGTVIVNLQQTASDGVATLRIFNDTDRLFELVMASLGSPLTSCPLVAPMEHRALVPYSRQGRRVTTGQRMWLDLNKGARIRLAPDHNCQGARQPVYQHIGASAPHVYRGSVRQPGPGEGTVVRFSPKQGGWELQIEGVSMLLGGWWLSLAAQGLVESIPVINAEPLMEGESKSPTRRARINQVDSIYEGETKSPTRKTRLHGSGTSSKMSSSSGLSSASRFSNSS
jgi:hypothetical protein